MKTVKDFMIKKVIYFSPDDSIFKVAKVFSQKNISGAPVVNKRNVVGIVSESDITKFMRLKLSGDEMMVEEPHMIGLMILSLAKGHIEFKRELKRISKIKVKDMMSNLVVSIPPDASISEAATIMEKHNVNRLPVIHKNKLVGIIARANLVRALIK